MGLLKTGYTLSYEISPIILVEGLASVLGALPLSVITEGAAFGASLLGGGASLTDLNRYFAHYRPTPGSSLANYQIAQYPFANQQIAANSVIKQPNNISVLMEVPNQKNGQAISRLAIMTAMKAALDTHVNLGGSFHVATPSYIYQNCILSGIRDVTPGNDNMPQTAWQFDFIQPLITQSDANQVLGSLMNKLENALPTNGAPTWSGQ